MGFRPERTEYKLVFADGSTLDGLTVKAGSIPTGQLMELQGAAQVVRSENQDNNAAAAKAVSTMIDAFASKLHEWDLEDPDTGLPVPPTREGIMSQDWDIVLPIILAWMEAIAGVDPTSRPASNSGGTSPVPLPPMVVSSPNPGN